MKIINKKNIFKIKNNYFNNTKDRFHKAVKKI